MDSHLRGHVVVVTGASGGIGSAIARKFAAEGARLVLQYHRGRSRIGGLQKELCAAEPLIVRADLTSENETRRLFGQCVKRFGRVDTLIANAGSWESRDVPLDSSLKNELARLAPHTQKRNRPQCKATEKMSTKVGTGASEPSINGKGRFVSGCQI